MPCTLDQMRAAPSRTNLRHPLKGARELIDAPVALAGDEAGRHVDGAAGENLELGELPLRVRAAVPLQSALKSRAAEFGRVDRKLILGEPSARRDLGGRGHFPSDRLGHALVAL